ncbi:MAG: colicin V production protein [Sphingobacteriales bacterium 50-39]|nr:CvpA family protein [Sphingobacteriales bacterium]OJW56706.1 MAG: colicin V production protein [Sphingobacteriales bacterium 50-39]
MWIDVLFCILLLVAVFKGLRQGFIIAVVATLAFIIGLAAAMKLSAAVAIYLKGHTTLSGRWLPVVAFVLVFLAVVLLVRWLGRLMEAAVDLAMMGWFNKLAGVLLYAAINTIILSVLLFYAVQLRLISGNTLDSSITYPFIRPWGAVVIDGFGSLIPFFKGMFTELEDFFGDLNRSLQSK